MSLVNCCARAAQLFSLLCLTASFTGQPARADAAQEAMAAAQAAMAAAQAMDFTEDAQADGTEYDESALADASDLNESDSHENDANDNYRAEGEGEQSAAITGYSDDPLRAEVSFDFIGQMRMNYLTLRAKEDLVVLHDVVINRGNCGYTLSGRMDAPFPVSIAFGNGAKYLIKCSTVLEVTVQTNFGEHTYRFNQ